MSICNGAPPLGSASFKLLKQSQSLAGRLSLVDMSPLMLSEVYENFNDTQSLWIRGGFPNSYLAKHINASAVAGSLGISASSTSRYLDHLCDTLMVRRLEPYFINLGKRLVKSPRVYVRDSGLLHHLLGIHEVNDLLGHPSTGACWEGFVIEQIAAHLPEGALMSFYRTTAGAELDVVVEIGMKKIGFEVKFSSAPKVTKGFWQACKDVGVDAAYIVSPVEKGWIVNENVEVISVLDIAQRLNSSTA